MPQILILFSLFENLSLWQRLNSLDILLHLIEFKNISDTPVHVVSNVQHGADILVQGDTLHIPVPGVHKVHTGCLPKKCFSFVCNFF